MKAKITYLVLLLLTQAIHAQEANKLAGVWKGDFYVDSTKKHYPFELTISEDNGKYTGYSRIAFEENGVNQVVFRDHKIRVNENEVIIEDDNQLSRASSVSQPKEVKKTMILRLSETDSTLLLEGTWSTNRTRRFLPATGTTSLQRKNDFRSTEIYKKLAELKLAENLSFTRIPEEITDPVLEPITLSGIEKAAYAVKKSRQQRVVKPRYTRMPGELPLAILAGRQPAAPVAVKQEKPVSRPVPVKDPPAAPAQVTVPVAKKNLPLPVITNAAVDVGKRVNSNEQALYYRSDSLQLTLYDNGEIDGDTVSVLLNGKVIIARKGLDTKPNSYTIYFDRDTPDSQLLVMYAENLGAIPPNTGLLVVKEGKSVYEVRFSADLKTNAAIVLRRRRD